MGNPPAMVLSPGGLRAARATSSPCLTLLPLPVYLTPDLRFTCGLGWLYFSIVAKFQPVYTVSDTLCCNANVLELI
ncbi:unnamed protein product [Coccothraustes coccothraustes]